MIEKPIKDLNILKQIKEEIKNEKERLTKSFIDMSNKFKEVNTTREKKKKKMS